MTGIIKVAIIGAGAAGLCAARELLSKGSKFVFTVFEGTSQVGGTWYYSKKVGNDEFGNPLHTSMYENLRTNLPKQAMAFPGYPFGDSLPSFLHHYDVQNYLVEFSKHYKIDKHVKFNTRVEDVQLVQANDSVDSWKLTLFDYNVNERSTESFDAVMVCNGHYFVPNKPQLKGLDIFKNKVLHSHDYRIPGEYTNQSVVLLGARSSGTDIAVDLSKTAKQVYMANRGKKLVAKLPENVEEKPMISYFTEDSVMFDDGSEVKCDSFIYCTGYKYKFPFLDSTGLIETTDRVSPLYKHLVHIKHPTLSFLGLCYIICPFPMFHYQAAFAVGVLDGTVKLPSEQNMILDEQNELQSRLSEGMKPSQLHWMGTRQWGYNDDLADHCGIDRLPYLVKNAYELATERKRLDLVNYKNDNFVLSDDGSCYELQ